MQFGDFELFSVSDGYFRLDGGAMFGVVPKVLWQKLNPPDEANRILLGLNCWLIRKGDETILVDTGIGDNYDQKFKQMFAIDHDSASLMQSLAAIDVRPEDVTRVVLTHLHFDHSGGNCVTMDSSRLAPAFPNATYIFQRGEYEYALKPDPRSRGSYLAQNWEAVSEAGQLELVNGDHEVIPGVHLQITGGHTRDHQIVKVVSGDRVACFLADLVPTDSHLKTPYVMGYDLYPKTTMEVKERILKQALAEGWLLFFEHAPAVKAGYLREKDGKFTIEQVEV